MLQRKWHVTRRPQAVAQGGLGWPVVKSLAMCIHVHLNLCIQIISPYNVSIFCEHILWTKVLSVFWPTGPDALVTDYQRIGKRGFQVHSRGASSKHDMSRQCFPRPVGHRLRLGSHMTSLAGIGWGLAHPHPKELLCWLRSIHFGIYRLCPIYFELDLEHTVLWIFCYTCVACFPIHVQVDEHQRRTFRDGMFFFHRMQEASFGCILNLSPKIDKFHC